MRLFGLDVGSLADIILPVPLGSAAMLAPVRSAGALASPAGSVLIQPVRDVSLIKVEISIGSGR